MDSSEGAPVAGEKRCRVEDLHAAFVANKEAAKGSAEFLVPWDECFPVGGSRFGEYFSAG